MPTFAPAAQWLYGYQASNAVREELRTQRAERDKVLLERIKETFNASRGRYGTKCIHLDVGADGESVSEQRVASVMRENNLSARRQKRHKPVTTTSIHKLTPSPNRLHRAFHCPHPNAVWLLDIT